MKSLKELREKKLTPAEKKKREEIAKAIEKDQPDMPMDKKMAIATAQAKKVAEEVELDEAKISVGDRVTLQPNKATLDRSLIGKAGVVTGMLGRDARVKFANGKTIAVSPKYLTVNESVELGEETLNEGTILNTIMFALGLSAVVSPVAFVIPAFLDEIAKNAEEKVRKKLNKISDKLDRDEKLSREDVGVIKDFISNNKRASLRLWNRHIEQMKRLANKTKTESVELDEAAPKLKGNNGPYTRQQIEKAAKEAKVDLGAKSRMMMALRDMK